MLGAKKSTIQNTLQSVDVIWAPRKVTNIYYRGQWRIETIEARENQESGKQTGTP